MFKPRDYQDEAINKGVTFFESKSQQNTVQVLPTGSGKSLVIGSIASNLSGKTLVLQPSKEILIQNFEKTRAFGAENLGVYSASLDLKQRRKTTFATIGSIHKNFELFKDFEHIIFDECHGTNAKAGMYKDFFAKMGRPILGLTATPYRLHGATSFNNATIKFITRTRPRVFSSISHITQNKLLFDRGYLCPVDYQIIGSNQPQLQYNSTGAEFSDSSIKRFNASQNINKTVTDLVYTTEHKHYLVFVSEIEQAKQISEALNNLYMKSAVVTGQTNKTQRTAILEQFKAGHLHAVINVGVLTTGFDFPELDCVIMARPTNSLSLYYQILGRGIRIHDSKEKFTFYDLGGNVNRFGKVENFEIVEPKPNMHRLKSERGFLTGIDLMTKEDLEAKRDAPKPIAQSQPSNDTRMKFGKFQGQCVKTVPAWYLKWVTKNFGEGFAFNQAQDEMQRRISLGMKV